MIAMLQRLRARSVLAAALLVPSLAACSLDDVLEVEIPGRVEAGALDNPALAQTLVNGVIGDLECAWNNWSAAAAHHSDEWIPSSGNLNMRNWGQRKIESTDAIMAQGDCTLNYGLYTPLQTARFQADDVFQKLEGFDASAVPNKVAFQATARAYGGYALIGLAEGFCSLALDGGPRMTPAQVMEVAEEKFTQAITLARQSGSQDVELMALVGRARARLYLQDWAGVIADASLVPTSYVKNVSRGESEPRRWNANVKWLNDPADAGSKHGTIAPHFRELTIAADGMPTQDNGVPDPRVNILTRGELSFDFATIHYYHDKYTGRGSPLPLATGREARLFIAEAAVRSGDLATAREKINERRTQLGLPTLTAQLSQDEMIEVVIEERRRELFQEGGHRLNDMLRFRGTAFQIPFLGEPGSIHPNGIDQTGAEYGTITCFPLPLIEENGNPNLS